MENTLLPEQKNQLNSWASQRDSILDDIGVLKTEKETLNKEVKYLAESRTEISNSIQQAIGRLQVLDKQEEIRAGFLTKENAELIAQKSTLQTELATLHSQIADFITVKLSLNTDIESATKLHNTVINNILSLEKIATDILSKCSANATGVSNLLQLLLGKFKEILDLSTENIGKHTLVLTEIPKMFVELKKQSIERTIINKHKAHE